jgi:hypothetical protein
VGGLAPLNVGIIGIVDIDKKALSSYMGFPTMSSWFPFIWILHIQLMGNQGGGVGRRVYNYLINMKRFIKLL